MGHVGIMLHAHMTRSANTCVLLATSSPRRRDPSRSATASVEQGLWARLLQRPARQRSVLVHVSEHVTLVGSTAMGSVGGVGRGGGAPFRFIQVDSHAVAVDAAIAIGYPILIYFVFRVSTFEFRVLTSHTATRFFCCTVYRCCNPIWSYRAK